MINYSEDDRCYHIGVRPGEVGRSEALCKDCTVF